MRLRFCHLIIRDFKSFLGRHELDLDLELGVHFMRGRNTFEKRLGSNGSGKSTIWDALVWCLYGYTPAGLRNTDVIPWSGATQATSVTLEIEVNGKQRVIKRTASPNTLKIDKKDVGPEAVVELVGMSFEVMTNTIILGQGRPLFFDLTPANKMKLLSDVKGLERWDDRSKRAADKTRELEREYDALEGEAKGLFATVGELSAAIKALLPKQEQWDVEYAERMDRANEFVRKNGKRMDQLYKDVATADLHYDGAMTEVKQLERDISKRNDNLAEARTKLAAITSRREWLVEKIDRLDAECKSVRPSVSNCPTCGQPLKTHAGLAKHRDGLLSEIKTAEQELSETKTKGAKLLVAELEKQLGDVKKHLDEYHAKAEEALRDHKAKQGELLQLEEQIKQIKWATDEAEENPHTKAIRMLRKRRNKLRADYDAAGADVVSCAKELERTRYWVKGFKDIKLHVIEELLQELELATAGMLEEVGLVGWRVRYVIERETKSGGTTRGLSIMIGSPKSKGKLVKWESWSGGEGQRLRVVGALALASVLLNHAGVTPSMEVLDEPTQHLSDEGVHDLCDYLAERARSHKRRIFYCDHQSVDGMTFASTITVRHDRGGSRIVGEGA